MNTETFLENPFCDMGIIDLDKLAADCMEIYAGIMRDLRQYNFKECLYASHEAAGTD